MKRLMVAGNWKMHTTVGPARTLAKELVRGLDIRDRHGAEAMVDIVICPPFTSLLAVSEVVASSAIALGGQNCHSQQQGAHTGEISAQMLADVGCSYVILGHSERRKEFAETNETIANKALSAAASGLNVILCVGETLEQRDAGSTQEVVCTQIREFVQHAGSGCLAACTIAYEPIWAIGTGRAASPEQANEVHSQIRTMCEEDYGLSPMLLYGGSVTPDNAAQLFCMPDIDGALVGGASLKSSSFLGIIDAAISAA